ncbi:MAG: hypothetical protein Q8P25_01925 [Candidatus Curtissbacteria bacterium]|nr:hypothetical protein [Candidatus Curtissbacteria bacterium]
MAEPPTEAETITPVSPTTAQEPEIVKQSMIQRLKSLLRAIGKGAKSAENIAPYHMPEPPQQPPKKDPPPQAFPTGS